MTTTLRVLFFNDACPAKRAGLPASLLQYQVPVISACVSPPMIEAQFPYVLEALRLMKDRGIASVDVRPDVQVAYNEMLQRKLSPTVWNTGGCKSWYLDKNGVPASWPWTPSRFFEEMNRPKLEFYDQVA